MPIMLIMQIMKIVLIVQNGQNLQIMQIVRIVQIMQIVQNGQIMQIVQIMQIMLNIRDARPAPPRGKTGCRAPPHEKQALPCPALQKLTKPAGRNGAKPTVDYTDYALPFGLRVGKWRKGFSFGLLYSLWLSGLQKDHLKSENVMFSLIKTPNCNTNPQ